MDILIMMFYLFKVKEAYAVANRALGYIVKVSPYLNKTKSNLKFIN